MMKWLQKLGKSLMLPVAVLPVAGILSGIGYWLCPAVMQGGEITGAIPMIGYFLTQAALALIDGAIIALLFAVGVAVGMSDDHDGSGRSCILADDYPPALTGSCSDIGRYCTGQHSGYGFR